MAKDVSFWLGPNAGAHLASRTLQIRRIRDAGDDSTIALAYDNDEGAGAEFATVTLEDNRIWQAVLQDVTISGDDLAPSVLHFNTGDDAYPGPGPADPTQPNRLQILGMNDNSSSSISTSSNSSSSSISTSSSSVSTSSVSTSSNSSSSSISTSSVSSTSTSSHSSSSSSSSSASTSSHSSSSVSTSSSSISTSSVSSISTSSISTSSASSVSTSSSSQSEGT